MDQLKQFVIPDMSLKLQYLMRANPRNPQAISSGNKKIQTKYTIYVLKLEKGRYYVGRCESYRLAERIKEHKDKVKGKGSVWTSIYPVVSQWTQIYEYGKSAFDEDRKVKQLMYIYGTNMVRGGTYSQIADLSPQLSNFILQEFKGALNTCFKCGRSGHFVRECPQLNKKEEIQKIQKQVKEKKDTAVNTQNQNQKENQKIKVMKQFWYLPKCSKCRSYGHYECDFDTIQPVYRSNFLKRTQCWNCKKYGHKAEDCWESDVQSDFYSYESQSSNSGQDEDIGEDEDDSNQDESGESEDGYQRNRSRNKFQISRNSCFNCGERGHWANQCPYKRKKYYH